MNVHSQLAPIDALAAHFRSSGSGSIKKHATLGVPSFLQGSLDEKFDPPIGGTRVSFTTKEVKTLIESISEVEFERWCLLDAAAFTFVTKVLLGAVSCLAKDQGFFRLIEALETLNDENNGLAMPKEQLVDYKNLVGESLVVKLLVYFIEKEGSKFSRRWVGLLLVELLEGSEVNRQRAWKMPGDTFKDIGEIIFSGADRMLKIVAGKIIWQMMRHFEDETEIRSRLSVFCQSGDFAKDFPLQDGSQWENEFATFITDMEEDRYDLDIGLPTGYNGYQVKLGNNNRINSDFGAISISIAEIFSIYIPPNRDHSPDWVDFKIVNISRVEFTSQGVTGDAMKDLTYFKLYLCDYEEDGYLYLLSMRPSSDSDNVMILCDKNDAEDFAEDVERYRDEVLKRKSNNLPASSAPVKDIQANPARHQSQQEKLDELERHRDNILKVLESPAGSHISSTTVTDPSGYGDALGFKVNEERLEKFQVERVTNPDLMEVDEAINDHNPKTPIRYSASSIISGQQKPISAPAAGEPIRRLLGAPAIVLGEIKETLDPSRSIFYATGSLPGEVSAPQSSPTYLRSSIRVQHTAKNLNDSIDSDSELSDITGVPDEKELELLFRDAPVKQRASGKPAELRVKLQKDPKPSGLRAPGPLDIPSKLDPRDVELGHNLENKKPKLLVPAAIELLDVPARPLFRENAAIKDQPELNSASRRQLRPRGMVSSGGATDGLKGNPKHATRNFLDGMLITEGSVQSRTSMRGGNRLAVPSTIESLAKKMVVGYRDTAETKSRPTVSSKSIARDTQGNKRHMGPEDTPTKKPRSAVPKDAGQMDGSPVMESAVASQGDLKKRPRPAVRTIAGLLDDVLTPPDTSGAQRKVKLKERLVGKLHESEKRTTNAETVNTWKNPVSKCHKKSVNPETPKLVSPEDTSIWELPESEHSGKGKKPPPKRKGKAGPKKQPPLKKAKQQPKKWTYSNKPAITPDLKPSERISDSEEEVKSAKEDFLHVNAPISKPKQKPAPKSASIKRAVIQSGDRGKPPTRSSKSKPVRKLALVSVPAKHVTVQNSDEEINMADEYRFPIFNPSMNTKPKPRTKLKPVLVRARCTISDDSEYEDDPGEQQKPPARSDTIFLRKAAPVSAPAKRIATQNTNNKNKSKDSGLFIGGRNSERAGHNAKSEPSRTAIKKAQETSNKHPKFDIFQNTSGANINSSWRPKTRLQAKMELAAKSTDQRKVTQVGNKDAREEAFPETESSEGSQSEPEDTSYSTGKFRKTRSISGSRRALSLGISGPGAAKRSLSLNSEIIVKSPKIHKQGIKTNRVETLIDENFQSLGGLVPKILSQPSTGSRERAGLKVVTSNHVDSENENIIVIPSESESESDIELMNATGSIRPTNVPGNYHGSVKPIISQLKVGSQLDSDIKMLDSPAKNQRKGITPAAGKWIQNLAPTAIMNPSPTIADINSNSPKLPSPATPRILDRIPKTPLVDDRLARKAQIISWNSEGPKNQGRTPVVDQSPFNLDCEVLPKSGRALSLYVLASEDEDRIVGRAVRPSPFIVYPTRRNTAIRSQVDQNGSPLLATSREQIETMELLQIEDDQEDDEGEDEDSVMADIVDDVAPVNQESCLESEQEGEWHPNSIKRLREARRTNRADYWNTNHADAGLEVGTISDDENRASAVADPLEEAGGFIEVKKSVAARAGRSQAHHEARVSRKFSIIEIPEDDIERTVEVAQVGPCGVSIAEHRKYERIPSRSKLVTEKTNNVTKPPPPIIQKRLLALNERPISALGRSPIFQPSPSAALRTLSEIDSFNVKGSNHPQTGFFNWLEETGFKKVNYGNNNCRNSHRGLNQNLQSADLDKALVNDGDFGGAKAERGVSGNFRSEPDCSQNLRGDPWGSESEDSSDFSIDNNEDSDSDEEGDGGETLSEVKEDLRLDWRRSLPDYHQETLVVLDQISEGILRYLMSGEELATEVIKNFEKQGNEIVRRLEESHKKEYETFLARLNIGKEKVQMKHAVVMEAVGHDMIELQEKQLTLTDLRKNINDDYSVLDHTISKLIARLEEELEGGM